MEYFIPSYIIDNIARTNIDARNTAIQSHKSRELRTKEIEKINHTAFTTIHRSKNKIPVVHMFDSENTWQQQNKPANMSDPTVIKTKKYVEFALTYLKTHYNRNGIDNNGSDIYVNVHFGDRYMNAFWDGIQLTLGDGDGIIFGNFSESLDVVTHEISHGVVQHASGLVYKDQSGALNEHYADVFGTAVQQAYLAQEAKDADWVIGNEVMGTDMYGESLRSMAFPGTAFDNNILGKDEQPAHMKNLWTSPEDNGGVHINSGIPNRVFYIVSMDIGTHVAGKLWYKSLHKLWPTSNFKDMVAVTIETTREMVRNKNLPQGATQVVRAAFNRVGL